MPLERPLACVAASVLFSAKAAVEAVTCRGESEAPRDVDEPYLTSVGGHDGRSRTTPLSTARSASISPQAAESATDTIYTANLFDGEGAGTVSVINGASWNAGTTTAAIRPPATAPAWFGTAGIAVDPMTNRVYGADIEGISLMPLTP